MRWLFALLMGLSPMAVAEEPPRALSCLSRWYPVQPLQTESGWVALLPDGQQIPFDVEPRTREQMEATPTIRDLFTPTYRRGVWKAPSDPGDDPGRIRIDKLFKATYGRSLGEVTAQTVKVNFFGKSIRIHRKAGEPLRRVIQRLNAEVSKTPALQEWLRDSAGGLAWRKIDGTDRLSAHSYGIAIDLNPARAHYWRWTKRAPATADLPQAITEAFEAEGFIWGGRWYHFDTMHFEWRPELLAPECED